MHKKSRLGLGQQLLRSSSQWHKDLLLLQTQLFTECASSRDGAQTGTSHFAAKQLLQLPDIMSTQNELSRGQDPHVYMLRRASLTLLLYLGRQKAKMALGTVERCLSSDRQESLFCIYQMPSDTSSCTPAHPTPL